MPLLSRRIRAALALVATGVACAVGAAAAEAGVYTVHACRVPSGAPAGLDGWDYRELRVPGSTGEIVRVSDCAAGRHFGARLRPEADHASFDTAEWFFTAPAFTRIVGYTLFRSVQVSEPGGEFSIFEGERSAATRSSYCRAANGCTRLGSQPAGVAAVNRFSRSGLNVGQVFVDAACLRENGTCTPRESNKAEFQVFRADMTLEDDRPPIFTSQPSGDLLDVTAPLVGFRRFSLAASDVGGGVYQALVEVDGVVAAAHTIDENGGRCAPPYRNVVPCKSSARGTFGFDTAQLADGAHLLRILVTDATGSNAVAYGPIAVTTRNGECAATPLSGTLGFTAGFGRRGRRTTATVRYGSRPKVSGRLADQSGAPIPRASICVATQNRAIGARYLKRKTVRTDDQGRFAYRVPVGASRLIRFVYRVPGVEDAVDVNLRVKARPRLATSRTRARNGQRVTFSGRLGGAPYPTQGALVQLQAKRGKRWQTFATPRARKRGRFRYRYRFTRTTGTRTYLFRARVPRQPTYPYATGSSSTEAVRVTP